MRFFTALPFEKDVNVDDIKKGIFVDVTFLILFLNIFGKMVLFYMKYKIIYHTGEYFIYNLIRLKFN